ncbi:hypothetical protein FJY90_00355 [Candidatus Gottesmanbacteria bacterium]|nr:hypothetical protein [Candidatus Gottesmanbacteria bacterium]
MDFISEFLKKCFMEKYKLNIIWLVIIWIGVMAAYLPVIQGHYMYHDDYYRFAMDKWKLWTHPQFIGYVKEYGRPLGIIVKGAYFSLIDNVNEANYVRFINLLMTSILAFLIYLWLKKINMKDTIAGLFSIMVITLPPFQTPAAMIANHHHIISAILSSIAFILAFRYANREHINIDLRFIKYSISIVLLLLLALLTYQPAAMFYWSMLLMLFLSEEYEKFRKSLSSIMYLFFVPLIAIGIYSIYINSLSSERAAISMNVSEKTKWFYDPVLIEVLNFWNIFPQSSIAFICVFIIALATILVLIDRVKMKDGWGRNKNNRSFLFRATLIILSVILSFLPNLLARENAASYRIYIAISLSFLAIVFFSLRKIFLYLRLSRLFVLFVIMFCFLGIYIAHYNVMNYYVNQKTNEFTYIRKSLQRMDLGRNKIVYLVQPTSSSPLFCGEYRDEFGVLTTKFRQDIRWIIKAAYIDLYGVGGGKTFDKNILTFSDGEEFIVLSPNEGLNIIDMNMSSDHSDHIEKNDLIRVSSIVGGYHPGRAFDKSIRADSFWETSKFPILLQVEYRKSGSKNVTKYILQTGNPERMPKNWELQGSNDGINWIILDEQRGQINWNVNEKRIFNINKPSYYRFYRFNFLEGNHPEILRIYEIGLLEK